MEDTGSQLIKKKMNLSFCFFFSGMFPSIWWWERGVSEGIDILCNVHHPSVLGGQAGQAWKKVDQQ